MEDLEHAEAAAVLGIELGVLRKRLSRARVRLADALDEIMPKSERR